jgi:hypothetical protein
MLRAERQVWWEGPKNAWRLSFRPFRNTDFVAERQILRVRRHCVLTLRQKDTWRHSLKLGRWVLTQRQNRARLKLDGALGTAVIYKKFNYIIKIA